MPATHPLSPHTETTAFAADRITDEKFMRRCLQLAALGRQESRPNPMVGAVIVVPAVTADGGHDWRIIGEGYHVRCGEGHAEVNAFASVSPEDEPLLHNATIYVSLEPCSHYGRTGPCARAVVEAEVARVVVAMLDPNPQVAGKGVKILQEAGIEVVTGVLENEAKKLNEVYLKWITTGIPFVALKTAMSLDGKIATAAGQSQWITNEKSRLMTHWLRDYYDGIMVGINTALKDNPSLTTRLPNTAGKNPVRIVVDSKGRLPLDYKLVTDGAAKTIVAVSKLAERERIGALEQAGVQVVCAGEHQVDLRLLMKELAKRDICSVMVEGGGQLNFSMLNQGLVDRIYAFIAPKIIGGSTALTPVEGEGFLELSQAVQLTDVESKMLDSDVLITARVLAQ